MIMMSIVRLLLLAIIGIALISLAIDTIFKAFKISTILGVIYLSILCIWMVCILIICMYE